MNHNVPIWYYPAPPPELLIPFFDFIRVNHRLIYLLICKYENV